MIYLFEDREDRLKEYLKGPLDYDYLKLLPIFDCKPNEIVDFISQNYKNAECILFHKSYTFPKSGLSVNGIKSVFIKNRISFVTFSGGVSSNIFYDNGVMCATANSKDMYKHLSSFVSLYKEKDEINIPYLLFGENYLLNTLLGFQNKISNIVFDLDNREYLNSDRLEEIKDEIEISIKEFELLEEKQKLLDWLENFSKRERQKEDGDIKMLEVRTLKYVIEKWVKKHSL